ncbi:MAG TPA: von Willebrand factor type A domain-containing protein, partial [Thermoguttaceae bacterium]|nr:von Willebrand factor type A domain-containing protein [Thermoguttaceae bacterium]
MKKRSKRLRIVEALTACVALGVLICLLLPAIQAPREAARRMQMKAMGRSMHNFHDSSPGWVPPVEDPYYLSDDVQYYPQSNDTKSWLPNEAMSYESAVGGRGPDLGDDKYNMIVENAFLAVKDHPLSTFSIDVDTASYANVRRFLLVDGQLPPPDAVRIEEMINYFDYDYAGPTGDVPLAVHLAAAACPWKGEHRLVRVALKGMEVPQKERPASNLVFLLDVSG